VRDENENALLASEFSFPCHMMHHSTSRGDLP
jgi:hypothetical protein